METKMLTIMIPCLNERLHLERTLRSLIINMKLSKYPYDILVIDNGSTDGSQQIAKNMGVNTIVKLNCSISELRNLGARSSLSPFLAFIDADVEITAAWTQAITSFIIMTCPTDLIITGATYLRPPNASILENHWFNGKEFRESHINGGNLITTRYLFDKIGGFDPSLPTGEDWDFCSRAEMSGATIRVDHRFKVYHHGFPKNALSFFRREVWHGQGDFLSLKSFRKSKPAVLAIANGVFLIASLLSFILANSPNLIFAYLLGLAALTLTISLRRSIRLWQVPGNALLASIYLYARLCSFITVVPKLMPRMLRPHER